MTKSLITNRYNVKSPTMLTEKGTAVSVPMYFNPSVDKKKEMLNAFRVIKQEQLVEMGYNTPRESNSVVVVDQTAPTLTPIEQELGMNEDSLRAVLFARQGITDRTIKKLQDLTGVSCVTRRDVEAAQKLWNDEIFGIKKTTKTSD